MAQLHRRLGLCLLPSVHHDCEVRVPLGRRGVPLEAQRLLAREGQQQHRHRRRRLGASEQRVHGVRGHIAREVRIRGDKSGGVGSYGSSLRTQILRQVF